VIKLIFKENAMIERRRLGLTNIEVSLLGIGTLTMSPMQRHLSVEDGAEVILAALSKGVTFIDTAQMYGSYPQLAAALKCWRSARPVVASKSAARTYDVMKQAVEDCLQQTGLQQIDIFLLHAVRDSEDLESRSEALACLKECRKNGLIKAIGASSHSARTIEILARHDDIEILHPMYNRDGIGILDASLDQMTAILRAARLAGKGVYAMKPLGGGHLRNDAQAALNWIFSSDAVDAVVVGMTSLDEVEMNSSIAQKIEIAPEFAHRVAGQPRKLFINSMICQNCSACVKACQQLALKAGMKNVEVDHSRCVLCGYCAPVCPKFAIRIV